MSKIEAAYTTSLDVAATFGKRHSHVIRAIEALPNDDFRLLNFEATSYKDSYGRDQKAYAITRDGLTLLGMGFTGAKAQAPKRAIIKERFESMNEKEFAITQVSLNGEDSIGVSAKELHAKLEIAKDFSDWIKAQFVRADLIEGVDFLLPQKGEQDDEPAPRVIYPQKGENKFRDPRGRKAIDYVLSIDAAKQIAMMSQSPKAKAIRLYFIEVEKRYRAQATNGYAIPQDYAEALELAAKQVREIKAKQALIEANNALIAEQKAKIEADKPRIDFANRLLKSEGSLSLRDYAKVLCAKGFSIGEKRLFEKLRKIGILDKNNKPYQKYVESGIFSLKSSVYPNKSTGDSIVYTQTRITAKGQEHIYALIAPKNLFTSPKGIEKWEA
jgi:anti-repressor protein